MRTANTPDTRDRRRGKLPPMSRTCRILSLLVTTACLAGCDRPQPQPEPPTPLQTARALVEARAVNDYQKIGALCRPGTAEPVVDTLAAVDALLQQNERLCEYIRQEVGPGLAGTVDQSHWGHNLDLFSTNVKLLDEHIDGDMATVSFMVNNQLPARRTQFVRLDGRWYYDPGTAYSPELPEAFREMARGLRQVRRTLQGGPLSPQAIRERPQLLIREVASALGPGLERLPQPPPPTTQPEAP